MEMNMIGELNMYKEAGIKPNFSDIARRYGKDRHTVASYWKADGSDPGDARRNRKGSFEPHIEEVRAKAQLPGVTKRGIYEYLVHRYPAVALIGPGTSLSVVSRAPSRPGGNTPPGPLRGRGRRPSGAVGRRPSIRPNRNALKVKGRPYGRLRL